MKHQQVGKAPRRRVVGVDPPGQSAENQAGQPPSPSVRRRTGAVAKNRRANFICMRCKLIRAGRLVSTMPPTPSTSASVSSSSQLPQSTPTRPSSPNYPAILAPLCPSLPLTRPSPPNSPSIPAPLCPALPLTQPSPPNSPTLPEPLCPPLPLTRPSTLNSSTMPEPLCPPVPATQPSTTDSPSVLAFPPLSPPSLHLPLLPTRPSPPTSPAPSVQRAPLLPNLLLSPPKLRRPRSLNRRNFSISSNFSLKTVMKTTRRRFYGNVINLELRCYLEMMPFYCGRCFKLPVSPITTKCGHTNCKECLAAEGACSCGEPAPRSLGINILVQNLIQSIPLPTMEEVTFNYQSRIWMSKYSLTTYEMPSCLPQTPDITVRDRAVTSEIVRDWMSRNELECLVCTNPFWGPITTPCGHTFCRVCLERSLDTLNVCPLCKQTVHWYEIEQTAETVFVNAALNASGANLFSSFQPEPWLPIVPCNVVFPMLAYPLFVFQPQYRLMLRRCLAGDRRFGMAAAILPGNSATGKAYADYGTILEIRDCVRLPDGSSLVCTMGVGRFHVYDRCEVDGYHIARVEEVRDRNMQPLGLQESFVETITPLFWLWRRQFRDEEFDAIVNAIGSFPTIEQWTPTDGPALFWWVTAILPMTRFCKYATLTQTDCMFRLSTLYRCLQIVQRRQLPPLIPHINLCVRPIILPIDRE